MFDIRCNNFLSQAMKSQSVNLDRLKGWAKSWRKKKKKEKKKIITSLNRNVMLSVSF